MGRYYLSNHRDPYVYIASCDEVWTFFQKSYSTCVWPAISNKSICISTSWVIFGNHHPHRYHHSVMHYASPSTHDGLLILINFPIIHLHLYTVDLSRWFFILMILVIALTWANLLQYRAGVAVQRQYVKTCVQARYKIYSIDFESNRSRVKKKHLAPIVRCTCRNLGGFSKSLLVVKGF